MPIAVNPQALDTFHCIARLSQEQMGIDEDRGNRHSLPFQPPCSAGLPSPMPTTPMRGNRPAAIAIAFRRRAWLTMEKRHFLGEGILHRSQAKLHVSLCLLFLASFPSQFRMFFPSSASRRNQRKNARSH
jgi:hypothetical protein